MNYVERAVYNMDNMQLQLMALNLRPNEKADLAHFYWDFDDAWSKIKGDDNLVKEFSRKVKWRGERAWIFQKQKVLKKVLRIITEAESWTPPGAKKEPRIGHGQPLPSAYDPETGFRRLTKIALYSKSHLEKLRSRVVDLTAELPNKKKFEFGKVRLDNSIGPAEEIAIKKALNSIARYFASDPKHGTKILNAVAQTLKADSSPIVFSEAKLESGNQAENSWSDLMTDLRRKPDKNKEDYSKIGELFLSEKVMTASSLDFPRLASAIQNELFELAWALMDRKGKNGAMPGNEITHTRQLQVLSWAISRGLERWLVKNEKYRRNPTDFRKDFTDAVELYKVRRTDGPKYKWTERSRELIRQLENFGSGAK